MRNKANNKGLSMNKKDKICPHPTTIQSESDGLITTYCADCMEILKTELMKVKFRRTKG